MPGRPPLEGSSASTDRFDRLGLGTRAVHPPVLPAQQGEPVAPVLDLASTYSFDTTGSFATASEAKTGAGYVYTRWANPTIDAFESAVAALEGSDEAEAFASGMAAISTLFLALCPPGSRVVATRQLYGGTFSLLSHTLPSYEIETVFVDAWDHPSIEQAVEGASLLYCETIGNPRVRVTDIPALAAIAASADIPLAVDNTFASPILCRPLEHGADVVVHSATKFLGGHHDLIGGVVCSSPAFLDRMRELSRELGAVLSPFNAWLAARGMATLHLRVERSSRNALRVAQILESHPRVEQVHYPALDSSPDKPLADRLLGGEGGGTLAFEVAGGIDAAARFQEKLRLVKRAASLGGTHSLIVHAASVTHTQLSPEELEAAEISPGLCRLSIGVEDVDDIIEDLLQALDDQSSP